MREATQGVILADSGIVHEVWEVGLYGTSAKPSDMIETLCGREVWVSREGKVKSPVRPFACAAEDITCQKCLSLRIRSEILEDCGFRREGVLEYTGQRCPGILRGKYVPLYSQA